MEVGYRLEQQSPAAPNNQAGQFGAGGPQGDFDQWLHTSSLILPT